MSGSTSSRSATATAGCPSGSASTTLSTAEASADPRPNACTPRRDPATSSATDSSWVSPVSSVRKPGSSAKPPCGPRRAYTGTPAEDSASMSRSTVRVDTSSSRASADAGIRPR